MQAPHTIAPPPAAPGPAAARPRRRGTRLSLGHAITLLAGLLAVVLVFSVLRERGATFPAAVAAGDLRAGDPVAPAALSVADVSADGRVRGRLLDRAAAMAAARDGWVATRTIQEGELLVEGDLQPPAASGRRRAMSVPVAPSHAVGGALDAGDRVDVIVVGEDGRARVVVGGAEVLAVNRPGGVGIAGAAEFSVTVAVDAEQALALAGAIRSERFELVRTTGAAPAPQGADQ